MIETRIFMIGSLALFAGLVVFDNLTDYETNFVRLTCAEHGHHAARKRAYVPKHFLAVLVGGGLCPDHRRRGHDGARLCRRRGIAAAPLRSPDASFNRA
jgi:hypothetical protein